MQNSFRARMTDYYILGVTLSQFTGKLHFPRCRVFLFTEMTSDVFLLCQGHRQLCETQQLLSARVAVKQLNKVSVLNRTPVEMDGFGSDFSAGGSGGKIDTGTIMEQVKVQIAVANAQELLQRMTDKCFKKCIGKPGNSLDNSEQKCIAMCMDRYMDAWNTVSRTYNSRLQKERARM
ncbi:hypothetical protein CRENBAI_024182 [Crenichthys baileyi]|uniref:Tim10-like domain-containing protein n=1 Tax=Crenichthys baileyi TaxID=28760 RepID=A0AAV9RWG6_9TELE